MDLYMAFGIAVLATIAAVEIFILVFTLTPEDENNGDYVEVIEEPIRPAGKFTMITDKDGDIYLASYNAFD